MITKLSIPSPLSLYHKVWCSLLSVTAKHQLNTTVTVSIIMSLQINARIISHIRKKQPQVQKVLDPS